MTDRSCPFSEAVRKLALHCLFLNELVREKRALIIKVLGAGEEQRLMARDRAFGSLIALAGFEMCMAASTASRADGRILQARLSSLNSKLILRAVV
jgi:hypothetical protein